jgi:hypothetical protein
MLGEILGPFKLNGSTGGLFRSPVLFGLLIGCLPRWLAVWSTHRNLGGLQLYGASGLGRWAPWKPGSSAGSDVLAPKDAPLTLNLP